MLKRMPTPAQRWSQVLRAASRMPFCSAYNMDKHLDKLAEEEKKGDDLAGFVLAAARVLSVDLAALDPSAYS